MPMLDILKLGKSEKPKHTSTEVIDKCVNALDTLHENPLDKGTEKAKTVVSKCLKDLKYWLFHAPTDDDGYEPTKEHVVDLAHKILRTNMLHYIVLVLDQLEFEVRKDAAQVFGAIVRIKEGPDELCPGAAYVAVREAILEKLIDGYDNVEMALNCGSMFRDCVRDKALAAMALDSESFNRFFDLVEVANFEIASDAFASFKDLLTRHKSVVGDYLSEHYDDFFARFNRLLASSNYVTRRQSLKLLAELLLSMDKANMRHTLCYVSNVDNLKTMMNLLKDSSRSIQYEAFHVFKVFVANPTKPQAVIDILVNNREKLLKYLEDFHTDKDDTDDQFKEEKAVVIRAISVLGREPQPSSFPADSGPQGQAQQQQPQQQQQHLPVQQQQPQQPVAPDEQTGGAAAVSSGGAV